MDGLWIALPVVLMFVGILACVRILLLAMKIVDEADRPEPIEQDGIVKLPAVGGPHDGELLVDEGIEIIAVPHLYQEDGMTRVTYHTYRKSGRHFHYLRPRERIRIAE